jgi:hypothetical protein
MPHCADASTEPVLAAIAEDAGAETAIRMNSRVFAVVGISDEVAAENIQRLCAQATLLHDYHPSPR